MIKEILKTLSDTEIMAVADQLVDPNIDETFVYHQLVSKSNVDTSIDQMFDEVNSDQVRGTLPRLVMNEITKRFRDLLCNVHLSI